MIEIRRVVNFGERVLTGRDMRELFGMMEMFYIFIAWCFMGAYKCKNCAHKCEN